MKHTNLPHARECVGTVWTPCVEAFIQSMSSYVWISVCYHTHGLLGDTQEPAVTVCVPSAVSEHNGASLLCRITQILNVTREIDNFYPEIFKYLNIR